MINFIDYGSSRLDIPNPNLVNGMLLMFLGILIILTIRKNMPSHFLDISQTIQLRGIAILLVILDHLWVHVAEHSAILTLGDEAVAIFLFLSGYGLKLSIPKHPANLFKILSHRFRRIMVPYWLATIIFLFLDLYVQRRYYTYKDIILTSLGININLTTQNIDYVRWYITFLLIWYIVFYISELKLKIFDSLSMLFIFANTLSLANYYFLKIDWINFYSFSFGCAIARYQSSIQDIFNRYIRAFCIGSIAVLIYVLTYDFLIRIPFIEQLVYSRFPNILLMLVHEINSIIFCIGTSAAIAYVGKRGWANSFLGFFGRYSYEIFLLHGALLVRYNTFFLKTDMSGIFFGFILFIIFISGISYLFKGLTKLSES